METSRRAQLRSKGAGLCILTETGTSATLADHRLPLRSGDIESFALALAAAAGVKGVASPAVRSKAPAGWIAALVRDLHTHRGSSLVIAGDCQPPAVHALAHAINDALGNV